MTQTLEKYDNDHQLVCNRCRKEIATYSGALADGFPRTVLCECCVLDIIDSMQCALSL